MLDQNSTTHQPAVSTAAQTITDAIASADPVTQQMLVLMVGILTAQNSSSTPVQPLDRATLDRISGALLDEAGFMHYPTVAWVRSLLAAVPTPDTDADTPARRLPPNVVMGADGWAVEDERAELLTPCEKIAAAVVYRLIVTSHITRDMLADSGGLDELVRDLVPGIRRGWADLSERERRNMVNLADTWL